jgi:hypothetical protein
MDGFSDDSINSDDKSDEENTSDPLFTGYNSGETCLVRTYSFRNAPAIKLESQGSFESVSQDQDSNGICINNIDQTGGSQGADGQSINSEILLLKQREVPTIKTEPDCKDKSFYNGDKRRQESTVPAVEVWSGMSYFSDSLVDMIMYECSICWRQVESLTDHLGQEHDMTTREYSLTHPSSARGTAFVKHR